jgi:hypothetical protein
MGAILGLVVLVLGIIAIKSSMDTGERHWGLFRYLFCLLSVWCFIFAWQKAIAYESHFCLGE